MWLFFLHLSCSIYKSLYSDKYSVLLYYHNAGCGKGLQCLYELLCFCLGFLWSQILFIVTRPFCTEPFLTVSESISANEDNNHIIK